jgi:membrane fusion protein (multidrug efflux system)
MMRVLLRVLLLLGVPLLIGAVALHYYAEGGRYVETENAYVKAHIVAVSAEVPGRVAEVAVRDHQAVTAGQFLFRLDAAPFDVALARARAQLAAVRTEIETLRAEHRVALAEATEAEERIRFLTSQLERQARLREKGMVREDAYDDAATLDLSRTRIAAPTAGIVSNLKLQPGEHVATGASLFSLIPAGEVWIEANFKETQLAGVRVGQPVRVVADAYPGVEFAAKVRAISPATGAQFALLPPQNASGNWIKIVQRIPVLIDLEAQAKSPADGRSLRAGMTVTVSVDTGQSRGLPKALSAFAR